MATLTPNYSFDLPAINSDDDVWGGYLDANWSSIDTLLKGVSNAAVAAQADATTGVGRKLNEQVFIANGTFTTPANTLSATIFEFEVVGGGGGGGGGSKTAITGNGAGSGGGSGGAVRVALSGFTASQAVTIAVGAKGVGGNSSGGDGTPGTTSSVTVAAVLVISCTGGRGGLGSGASNGSFIGGAPGASSIGIGASGLTLVLQCPLMMSCGGAARLSGITTAPAALNDSGDGANSPYGNGGQGSKTDSTAGGDAGGQGAGGGGAKGCPSTGSAGAAGGAGSDGIVFVRWVT